MEEFRKLLLERAILILVFIVLSILYLWAYRQLGSVGLYPLRFLLTVGIIGVFLILLRQISSRRKRMLEILGRR